MVIWKRWWWVSVCLPALSFGCSAEDLFPGAGEGGAGAAAEGGTDAGGGVAGGAGATGEGGGQAACKAGAACDSPYCCDGPILFGCGHGQQVPLTVCGEAESCDAVTGECVCTPSAIRCVPGAPTEVQTCVLLGIGVAGWLSAECQQGEICREGRCTHVCDACARPGELSCSPDGQAVQKCEVMMGSACEAELVPVLDCVAAGMKNGCEAPVGEGASEPEQYCVNECNVHGVPLSGEHCGSSPDVLCAVLVCNAGGTSLEPDHTGCAGGGQTCSLDSDCKSCNCQSGFCVGSFVKKCGEALDICP